MSFLSTLTIPPQYKLILLGVALAGSCYGGYHARGIIADRDALKVEAQRQEEVIQANRIVDAYQQGIQNMANQLEEQSYANQAKRDKELSYYRSLAAQSGGLHDNGSQTSNSQDTATPGSNQATTGGTELSANPDRPLSKEATEFLLNQANLADRVVDQYEQCQKYVESLSGESK